MLVVQFSVILYMMFAVYVLMRVCERGTVGWKLGLVICVLAMFGFLALWFNVWFQDFLGYR